MVLRECLVEEMPSLPGSPGVAILKRELRKEIRSRLSCLSSYDVTRDSTKLVRALTNTQLFKNAETVAVYASMGNEVNVGGITEIAHRLDKRVLYPRVCGKDILFMEAYGLDDVQRWEKSPYGIREPPVDRGVVMDGDIDLVVVPGLAFDPWGGRLGQGGGFYDRFLRRRNRDGVMALAFEAQMVDQVPMNERDFCITKVLYPGRDGVKDAILNVAARMV